jgi:hypothetical protein
MEFIMPTPVQQGPSECAREDAGGEPGGADSGPVGWYLLLTLSLPALLRAIVPELDDGGDGGDIGKIIHNGEGFPRH